MAPNCFICGRCHQVPKVIADYVKCSGPSSDPALPRRSLLNFLSKFMDPELDFESSHRLINGRPALPKQRKRKTTDRRDEWPFTDPECKMSHHLQTEQGRIHHGTLVKIAGSDGGWSPGMANFFFQTRTSTFICYSEYVEVGPSTWSPSDQMFHCPTFQILGKQLAFRSACGRVLHLALSHKAAAALARGP